MKTKVISFFIMAVGVFAISFFLLGDEDIPRLILYSVLFGLAYALVEGYLKRASRFILKKSLKSRK